MISENKIHKVQRPSLELGWLVRHDKQVSLPDVFIVEGYPFPGSFWHQWKYPQSHHGITLPPLKQGAIVLSSHEAEEAEGLTFAATLAHEWRHCWQSQRGWSMVSQDWDALTGDYADRIQQYFAVKHEIDALRFEVKHAPCPESEWRLALTSKNTRHIDRL